LWHFVETSKVSRIIIWTFWYIFSCREKKDTEVQILETSKDVESESISELEVKNRELREKVSISSVFCAAFL